MSESPLAGKAGADSAALTSTPDIKGRVFELASEVARLVCVEDVLYIEDKDGRRKLDLAANELGHLLKLPEPEFEDRWRDEEKPMPETAPVSPSFLIARADTLTLDAQQLRELADRADELAGSVRALGLYLMVHGITETP